MAMPKCLVDGAPSYLKLAGCAFPVSGVAACLWRGVFPLGCNAISQMRLLHVPQPLLGNHFKRKSWSIRSNLDGGDGNSSASSGSGRTRLFRTIEVVRLKLNDRIKQLRKDLPMKVLFFLVGFYCATAFATVIGQTGDWDILSAGLAVVVVEGIGALMYRASLPLFDKIKNMITMFNYWKAGLSLGLFLDSFKYVVESSVG
uniref:Ycf20-like protein n=1 Tax=Kalanchoe fedtschenkoi TaxID=63787 RepID=A0A7N0TD24_KALFE